MSPAQLLVWLPVLIVTVLRVAHVLLAAWERRMVRARGHTHTMRCWGGWLTCNGLHRAAVEFLRARSRGAEVGWPARV